MTTLIEFLSENVEHTSIWRITKKYDIVLADPPWSYYNDNGAAKFYNTMSDAELLRFPMRNLMTHLSILFLWATAPRLDFAMRCIGRWGLIYRGMAFVWIKTRHDGFPLTATGVRPSVTKPLIEFVLVASMVGRGRPLPISDESVRQLVFAPRREHSRKPDEVQERIEALYPNFSKIELFARRRRKGWDAWGAEV